ncbi:hypothetical protein BDV19DRAFT_392254 [Aspergillus venezuelensis]
MSSLFETYGLARSQSSNGKAGAPLLLNSSQKQNLEVAPTDLASSNSVQSQLVAPLEPVRELDWAANASRGLKIKQQRSESILHARGEAVEPRSQCRKGGDWVSCILSPVYNGLSMYSYACSNSVYNHKGIDCTHRKAFEKKGGQIWDHLLNDGIIAKGGLRAVLAKGRKHPTTNANSQTQIQHPSKASSSCAIHPQVKSAFNREILPWPVTPASWNDRAKLEKIIEDLKRFAIMAEKRLAELEPAHDGMNLAEFWDHEAARLFPKKPIKKA